MKSIASVVLIFFWIVLAADCILIISDLQQYRVFTKTLLVPVLLLALVLQTAGSTHTFSKFYICSALVLCFAGDLILLNDSNDSYFIAGLSSFLIAHIFYIIFFFHIHSISKKGSWILIVSSILIAAYIYFLLSYLWDDLIIAKMLVPVFIYAIVIAVMLFSAIKTSVGRRIKKPALRFFIPGAVLFVASDSILALHKFKGVPEKADLLIIVTYAVAQFLLTSGAIKIIKGKSGYKRSRSRKIKEDEV